MTVLLCIYMYINIRYIVNTTIVIFCVWWICILLLFIHKHFFTSITYTYIWLLFLKFSIPYINLVCSPFYSLIYTYLSIYLYIHNIYLPIYLLYLSTYVSIYLSTHVSINLIYPLYLSIYLSLNSNCVGIGNRRLFWALLFFTSSFLCIYFLSSKYLHHTYYCQDDNLDNIYFIPKTLKVYFIYWIKNSFILYYFEYFDLFFGKELYVLQKYPGFYGLSCISFLLGCYLAALLQV